MDKLKELILSSRSTPENLKKEILSKDKIEINIPTNSVSQEHLYRIYKRRLELLKELVVENKVREGVEVFVKNLEKNKYSGILVSVIKTNKSFFFVFINEDYSEIIAVIDGTGAGSAVDFLLKD